MTTEPATVPSDPPEVTVVPEPFFADDLTDTYADPDVAGDESDGHPETEPSDGHVFWQAEALKYHGQLVSVHKLIHAGTIGPNERKASGKFLADHGVA